MTLKKAKRTAGKKKDIPLSVVVTHMHLMEQRLSKNAEDMEKRLTFKIDKNTEDIQNLDRKITGRIDVLETNLTQRIDALEEDLIATMKDTVKIRSHVGMAVPDEM